MKQWCCPLDGSVFPYRSYLVRHVIRSHPQRSEEILRAIGGMTFDRNPPSVGYWVPATQRYQANLDDLTGQLDDLKAEQWRLAKLRLEIEVRLGLGGTQKTMGPNTDPNRRSWIKKAKVIAAYGGECACCHEKRLEFLTVDHVNGDGTEHRKALKKQRFYDWLMQNGFPQNGFRVLCMNCNMALGMYGYCPHQTKLAAGIEGRA